MISIPQILSVCLFEFKRSLTVGRLIAYFVLALFPPAMILLIARVSALTYYKLIIMFLTYVVCLLALLLWATPNVYSELESRNWLFVTARPRGRISILLGKFLAASLSAMLVCAIAILLSGLIVGLHVGRLREDVMGDLMSFLPRCLAIAALACIEYAAVFSLIGVFFQRRAMVMATVYILGVEMLFAVIPALISRLSVRYHLAGVTLSWLGWFLPGEKPEIDYYEMWFVGLPLWVNIVVLALLPIGVLFAAGYVIRNREYITADEV
jgi:ABC-type transport system involved in multi-copper enzyme maturation permease subunit